MLRVSCKSLCASAAPGVALTGKAATMSFAAQYGEATRNPEDVLGGKAYAYLRDQLTHYRSLQGEYAVKQTDVERARKAGNMCGLEFTKSTLKK